MDNMTKENDYDESGEMTKKVFILLFALCVVFILASVFVGIFEFIPRN